MKNRIPLLACSVVACSTFLALSAAPAEAQGRQPARQGQQWQGGGGVQNSRAVLGPREIQEMVRVLRLDEHQETIIRALHEGWRQNFDDAAEAARERTRERFREMRESGQWGGAINMGTRIATEWRSESDALVQSFFAEVQTILTDAQMKDWLRYERDWRRRIHISGQGIPGSLSGEDVDLVRLVEGLDLDERDEARIAPILDQYASDLDPLLIQRLRAFEETIAGNLEDFSEQTLELRQRRFENLQRRRVQIREVNERYMEAIAAQLGEENGRLLRDAYNQRAFRMIYQPTRAERYLDQVRRLDLTPGQENALQQIEADLRRHLEGLNQQLVVLQRKQELEDQQRFAQRMIEMGRMMQEFQGDGGRQFDRGDREALARRFGDMGRGQQGQTDPRRELFERRNEIVNRSVSSIHSLLNEQQQAAAPLPAERGRRGAGPGGGGFDRERIREMRERRERN